MTLALSENARKVLARRYLVRDVNGKPAETPEEMFWRVARHIAAVDRLYDPKADSEKTAETFYRVMADLAFLPNSPTLINAGTDIGQLSACFVLPIEDSISSIFTTLKDAALIQKSGGGTGFSFSRLRPRGDKVRSTHGVSSGPVSFIEIYDKATEVIKQGAVRRGANMAVLRVDHPDIWEFINAKRTSGKLKNFNLSVGVTDAFMEAVDKDTPYTLVNPANGETSAEIAREIFAAMAAAAWSTGDPGLLFLDRINRFNPTPELGRFEATNPCGEVPLLPYESCNLGSINLARMVKATAAGTVIDCERLKQTVHIAVHFLDNVIDANLYPLPAVETATRGNRKVGLGVMGFADMLLRLKIPYASDQAVAVAEQVMSFISREARTASARLAETRGVFPNFSRSIYNRPGGLRLRNATLTTIAPTGTISLIANCSSGIEPLFALAYTRNVMEGTILAEENPVFGTIAREEGFYTPELARHIAERGSLDGYPGIPEQIRRIFLTAHAISSEWHIKIQAAFQKYTDNAVAKTINLPHTATVADVVRAFRLAYAYGCKGITVYRDGSKEEQVLTAGGRPCGECSV